MTRSYDATTILTTLPNLGVEDLERIRARCSALLGIVQHGHKPLSDAVTTDDWLLAGLLHELKAYGVPVSSVQFVQRSREYLLYTKNVVGVIDWINAATPDLTKTERMAFANVAARSLRRFLTDRKIPVSLRAMLGNVANIPQALEQEFPGYVRAGLIQKLVTK